MLWLQLVYSYLFCSADNDGWGDGPPPPRVLAFPIEFVLADIAREEQNARPIYHSLLVHELLLLLLLLLLLESFPPVNFDAKAEAAGIDGNMPAS